MFAASALPGGEALVPDTFFKSWGYLLSADLSKRRSWSDLVIGGRERERILKSAVLSKGQFLIYLKAALADAGLSLVEAHADSSKTGKQLGALIVANLMKIDCGGAISFWATADGYTIDDQINTCKALQPGKIVTNVLGKNPRVDPVHLAREIDLLCENGKSISVGYAGEENVSLVQCSGRFPGLPVSVKIVNGRENNSSMGASKGFH